MTRGISAKQTVQASTSMHWLTPILTTPILTGSLGNHLIRQPSPISWIWPVTQAHQRAALWQPPLILTTHATSLLRLATARHPSASSIPNLLVVIAVQTHAFFLLLQRSHHYTRWTISRTSRVPSMHWLTPIHLCVYASSTQIQTEAQHTTHNIQASNGAQKTGAYLH
jgi:hypothetical protein